MKGKGRMACGRSLFAWSFYESAEDEFNQQGERLWNEKIYSSFNDVVFREMILWRDRLSWCLSRMASSTRSFGLPKTSIN